MMIDEKGQGMSNVDALLNKPPRVNDLLQVLAKVTSPPAASQPVVTVAGSDSEGCLVTVA